MRERDPDEIKNCCPTCGHEFDLDAIKDGEIFSCGEDNHCGEDGLTKDSLIWTCDDYAWVL